MLSLPHLIILFVVVLVVFGPEKLPDLARNLGKFMAEFRRVTGDFKSTFEGHMRDLERETEERRAGRTPAAAVPPPDPSLMAPPDAYPSYDNSIAPPEPSPSSSSSPSSLEEPHAQAPGASEPPKPTRAEGIVPAEAPRLVAREASATAATPDARSTSTPSEDSAEPVTDGQHRTS